MNPERWALVEELFHRAAECELEHRTALLDQACSHDPELRREVEALLSSDGSAGGHVQAAVRSELDAVGFPLTGQTISHYRILDGLGGGGMGLVYRAEDIKLGRRVALKFLPEDSAKDPVALGRFEREARSASALEHPNICPIYEFGEHEGQPFLVMQLLEGQTLRELISANPDKAPLRLNTLLNLAIQICDGLDAAQRQGIIHRDIKPANIFVTAQGQAKILDFGLAKLARGVVGDDGPEGTADETLPRNTPDLFLSRTGVAMGTAGYMSPEQVRGEKLDARTDLFSFGLVLYEMATGKRAFTGDTGPLLQEAILKQKPSPARSVNPELPAKLETIISKALEKNRDARYQSASELRAELETLQQELEPSRRTRRWTIAAGIFIVLAALGATIWTAKRRPPAAPDFKLRQLTANSAENAAGIAAISPDGKRLAYPDAKRMYVKLLETGETQEVPQPDALKTNPSWEIVGWFPDGTRFLANANPPGSNGEALSSQGTSIWVVPVPVGTPQKLRDEARAFAVSPDGSTIALATNKGRLGDRDLWLMGPSGEQARKFYGLDGNNWAGGAQWSPDGKRILYTIVEIKHVRMISLDLEGGSPITMQLPPETQDLDRLYDARWLPDGRFIYSITEAETEAISTTCNLWVMRFELSTGKVLEKPRRLTNWSDHCESGLSVSADSKRLAFLRFTGQFTTYVAELGEGGARISTPRHFTLTESLDFPLAWTPDSKNLFLWSTRNGRPGIYKQALDSDSAELVVTKPGEINFAKLSPDGEWLLYLLSAKAGSAPAPAQVVRLPVSGGSPQAVFTAQANSEIFCARYPSHLCLITEPTEDRKEVILTAFDPLKGRGPELTRFDLDPSTNFSAFALSPDGAHVAALRNPAGPIQLLSLRGLPREEIRVKGWNNMRSLSWNADGKGLLVGNSKQGGAVLLRVDLKGDAQVLWETPGGPDISAVASPDGRHVAISRWTIDENVWMMENF